MPSTIRRWPHLLWWPSRKAPTSESLNRILQQGQSIHPFGLVFTDCTGLSLSGMNGSSTVSFPHAGQIDSTPSHLIPSRVAPPTRRNRISPLQIGHRLRANGFQPFHGFGRNSASKSFIELASIHVHGCTNGSSANARARRYFPVSFHCTRRFFVARPARMRPKT